MQTVDAAGLRIGDDHPPRIMGVLNVSAESPYTPSVFTDPADAAEYVDTRLIEKGADIIDVGIESANKRFEILSADEELQRLDIATETIASVTGEAIYSIETRYAEVARVALDSGFDMVNDICGFADPEMPQLCEDYDVAVIKMASPPSLERPGALTTVDEIYDALLRGGLTDRTIVDPAFGGWSNDKTLADDRELFRRLREFRALDHPIAISINRKNFLRKLVGRSTDAALPASLAATALAVERGVHVLRTHDVAATVDAARIGDAFSTDHIRVQEVGLEELHVSSPNDIARYLDRIGVPTSYATDGIVGVYRLTGLTDAEQTLLSSAIGTAGGTVVHGPESSESILMVTPRQIRRLQPTVRGESGRIDTILERVDQSIR